MLAEAGYPAGSLKVVFKATTNYPYHIETAQIIVEWLREAGVEMTIEQLTWADWLSQCWVDKDFQMSMMNFFTLWESDFLYYSLWNSEGAFNYRAINEPEIDELTTKARGTVDRCRPGRDLQAGAAAYLRRGAGHHPVVPQRHHRRRSPPSWGSTPSCIRTGRT